MGKYFPVYAAILGVIALLLFLSPQIADLISADAPAELQSDLSPRADHAQPTKAPSLSVVPSTLTEGNLTIYPAWNAIGIENNTSSEIFSGKLEPYTMLGSKWIPSDGAVYPPQVGLLVYSASQKESEVSREKTDKLSSLKPSKGWNILYNSSDQPITDDTKLVFADNIEIRPIEMVKNKLAAKEVYLVNSSSSGISYKKINFPKEAIPPKSVFWFYIFR